MKVHGDDCDRMVAFYDFPETHWKHPRTTNVADSPFSSERLRTTAAKRFKRVEGATALIWKLLTVAEKRFRKLNAPHLLSDVFEGTCLKKGSSGTESPSQLISAKQPPETFTHLLTRPQQELLDYYPSLIAHEVTHL